MRHPPPAEAGFSLIEVLVSAAIVAFATAALGAFFAGSPAGRVAAAARNVEAAFAEARALALAADGATVVVAPAARGAGFSLRVYRGRPADAGFAAASGPRYESTAALAETALPLGGPGLAFAIDRTRAIAGFPGFDPAGSAGAGRPCPAGGAFAFQLQSGGLTRSVAIPCSVAPAGAAVAPVVAAPPAATPLPRATWDGTCAGSACTLPVLIAGIPACPAGTAADPVQPGLCVPAAAAHRSVPDQCGVPLGQLVATDPATTPPTDHTGSGLPCALTVLGATTYAFVQRMPRNPDASQYASVNCTYYSDGSAVGSWSGDFDPGFACPPAYTGCTSYTPQQTCTARG